MASESEYKALVARLATTCSHCKVAQLLGLVMLVPGVLICFLGWALGFEPISELGGLFAFTGLVTCVLSRLGAWWHH